MGHSWRQGEAQLALGRFRVPFANKGLLLPFSPFPLINKFPNLLAIPVNYSWD